jgi:CheY-like chemotaxis protein
VAASGEAKDLAIPEVRIYPFSFLLVNCRPVQEEMKKSRKLLQRRGSTTGDGRGKSGGTGEKSQTGGDWGLRVRTGGEQTINAIREEALAKVASETPDLILLDVTMPGMDGFTVCRRLKEQVEIRLAGSAATNQILVGPETVQRLGNHYQFEKVGRQHLKNLTAATDIYRIL